MRKEFKGAGWIAEAALKATEAKEPIYFDSLTQIVMPRVAQGTRGAARRCLRLPHAARQAGLTHGQGRRRRSQASSAMAAINSAALLPPMSGSSRRKSDRDDRTTLATSSRYFHPRDQSGAADWLAPRCHARLMFSKLGAAAGLPLEFGAARRRLSGATQTKRARDRNPAPSLSLPLYSSLVRRRSELMTSRGHAAARRP